jgi:hypothetical protein
VRRPTECGLSKNLREKSQVNTDSWHGLFDTKAGLGAGVSVLSQKRALTVHLNQATQRYHTSCMHDIGLMHLRWADLVPTLLSVAPVILPICEIS